MTHSMILFYERSLKLLLALALQPGKAQDFAAGLEMQGV